jgi:hypothetical protein
VFQLSRKFRGELCTASIVEQDRSNVNEMSSGASDK